MNEAKYSNVRSYFLAVFVILLLSFLGLWISSFFSFNHPTLEYVEQYSPDTADGLYTGKDPPRELDGRSLRNVIAFTRLYGYVRYFHPSDEAASLDWDRFVINGIKEVEMETTQAELTARLQKLFKPIAPTVQIFLGNLRPPPSAPLL